MYILCIECSRSRGMGHLFRSLLYASFLDRKGIPYIVLINNDRIATGILEKNGINYVVVDYDDESDWESPLITDYGADVWIQDKYETPEYMAEHIANNNILFCAIDEFGPGANLCDIHFGGMIFLTGHEMRGKRIYAGTSYVILNPDIERYKKVRNELSNIVISLGGSDPFGMTVEVVKHISKFDFNVTVIIGPEFKYRTELEKVNTNNYPILQNVPSLIEEFSKYDFAITGGGVTCCEANACGLPCAIIANADHEKHTGAFMERNGGAIYAGSFEDWDKSVINRLKSLNIEKMSRKGMDTFDTKAIDRMFSIIQQER